MRLSHPARTSEVRCLMAIHKTLLSCLAPADTPRQHGINMLNSWRLVLSARLIIKRRFPSPDSGYTEVLYAPDLPYLRWQVPHSKSVIAFLITAPAAVAVYTEKQV